MTSLKALVLRAAGTNCDVETQYALSQAGFQADRVHVFRIMENPDALKDYRFLVIPGGFSYGDDVAAGKILANQMLHRLSGPLNDFLAAGKLVLGICNGFQVMLKSGLLPWGRVESAQAHRDATLGWNDSGKFEDRWVHLTCDSEKCAFLNKGEIISLPIAHGEGKFVPKDDTILAKLASGDQIALRYVDDQGRPGDYPVNPNGSVDDIAGICDPTGRAMGLMPHPERFVQVTHHPQWTRREVKRADGTMFFRNAMDYLRNS